MRQREPLATKRAVVIARVSGCGRSVIWTVAHEVAVQFCAATPGLRTWSASLMSWAVFGTVKVTVWPFVAPRDTAGPETWLQLNAAAPTDWPPSSVIDWFCGTVSVAPGAITALANAILATAARISLTCTITVSVFVVTAPDEPSGPVTLRVNS